MSTIGLHGLTAPLFDLIDVRQHGTISFADAVRFMKLLGDKLPREKQDGVSAKLAVVLEDDGPYHIRGQVVLLVRGQVLVHSERRDEVLVLRGYDHPLMNAFPQRPA